MVRVNGEEDWRRSGRRTGMRDDRGSSEMGRVNGWKGGVENVHGNETDNVNEFWMIKQ